MFLRKAFVAFSALISLLTSVDTPGVELGCRRSALPSLPSVVVPGLPFLPAADFPPLHVSSLYDKPAPIGFSPANFTAIRQQPLVTVVGHANLGLAVNETFASIPKDVSWVQLVLVAAEVVQDGQWEDVGYIAYQIYVLVRSAQLDLADLVSLISLLDIPFTDLIWIPVLLVALESTLAIPFLAQKVHRFGRKALQWVQFMALGGVLVTTLPHLACIVVGFAVPIIIDHILRQARKIERFLNRVVRTVVDIGTRSVVLVLRSHWAIVGRVAYNVYCLLATIAFSSTFLESIATAFDVPAADLIWLPALLFALESTPRILFLSHKLYRYGRRILRLIDIAMTFAGVVVTMLPHFLCVVLGLVMPFAVRHGIHTLRKMDRFLVRIVHAAIAAFVCAIRAGSSVTERLSFAVQDLCRTASRFVRLFITATHPCLRIVVLHLYYLAARYLYRAKRIRAISKKLLRLVVAQVSVITDIALRVVAWVGRIAKPSASPVMAQMPCITNDLLELEPTAAPVPFKKRNRADKRYQRGKKLHVDVEEKGKRKRA